MIKLHNGDTRIFAAAGKNTESGSHQHTAHAVNFQHLVAEFKKGFFGTVKCGTRRQVDIDQNGTFIFGGQEAAEDLFIHKPDAAQHTAENDQRQDRTAHQQFYAK